MSTFLRMCFHTNCLAPLNLRPLQPPKNVYKIECVVALELYVTSTNSPPGISQQVKSRAENQGGSVSMIFLANTLREIIKKSREILPHCPPILVDGRKRRVAVVDFTPATSHLPRSIRIRPVSDLCRDDEHIFV